MAVYTRRGDAGETDLAGGRRVYKDEARVEVYGTLDELIAALGASRALCMPRSAGARSPGPHLPALGGRLLAIQRQLSALCGWFASPGADLSLAGIDADGLRALEAEIDEATGLTGPLREFVMPGASELEAALHLARAICRRAERRAVSLSREEAVDRLALSYLNRLSDWLFAQARVVAQTAPAGQLDDPG